MTREYRVMSAAEANRLIDWAEENNVEWDIWNPEDMLSGFDNTEIELWMERYP